MLESQGEITRKQECHETYRSRRARKREIRKQAANR